MRGWIVIGLLVMLIGWSSVDFVQSGSSLQNHKSNEENKIAVGEKAPNFLLNNLANEEVSLAQYIGQPVMINFWATWCPPCRAEMPSMEQFYLNHDVVVLAINATASETSVNEVDEFVGKLQLTFPVLLDHERDVASLYEVRPLPTSVFIDRNGIIHHIQVGPMNEQMMVRMITEM